MQYFDYGQTEMDYLIQADPVLGEVITRKGLIKRQITIDPFEALVESILSQQISGKAAETILSRLRNVVDTVTPAAIMNVQEEVLRSCGLSLRKVSYLKSAAYYFINSDININSLSKKTDDEIICQLIDIKGVGVWTAEMLLIFSLGRRNILSYNDFGIQKGLMKLHNLNKLSKPDFEKFKNLYSPYCSIASFYLWSVVAEK